MAPERRVAWRLLSSRLGTVDDPIDRLYLASVLPLAVSMMTQGRPHLVPHLLHEKRVSP